MTRTMTDVCAASDLTPERGAAALVGETQVALFLLSDGTVRAVQQKDPYSGANVLARGIVGSHRIESADAGEPVTVPTLASPMYKQVWRLDTGEVLDAAGGEDLPLTVFDARVEDGRVLVAVSPSLGDRATA